MHMIGQFNRAWLSARRSLQSDWCFQRRQGGLRRDFPDVANIADMTKNGNEGLFLKTLVDQSNFKCRFHLVVNYVFLETELCNDVQAEYINLRLVYLYDLNGNNEKGF